MHLQTFDIRLQSFSWPVCATHAMVTANLTKFRVSAELIIDTRKRPNKFEANVTNKLSWLSKTYESQELDIQMNGRPMCFLLIAFSKQTYRSDA